MNKKTLWVLLGDFILSFFFSNLIYLYFLQTPVFRRREIILYFGLIIFLSGVIHLFLTKYILRKLSKPGEAKRFVFFSLLAGLLIVLALGRNPPYVIYFLPQHEMTLELTTDPSGADSIKDFAITGFESELGDISYSGFVPTGSWERNENTLRFSGKLPGALKWQGRTGLWTKIHIEGQAEGVTVTLTWNGNPQIIELAAIGTGEQVLEQQFHLPLVHYLPAYVSLFVVFSFLLFVLTIFFSELELPLPRKTKSFAKFSWIWYAIPMILVWGIYLAALWPGMMSPDSIDQWEQVLTGRFNDSHPVASTLIMWAVTRIWLSPAAIAIFQILALSLTVAWGIGYLREIGLPEVIAWIVAILFAISPVNAAIVNTLWKDIPYSIAVLLFSLQILRIVFSRGKWLDRRLNWLWFGLVGLLISILRHNGFPIPIISLVMILVTYKPQRKLVILSLLTTTFLWFLVRNPLYHFLNVNTDTGTTNAVFIHHIAAHLANGDEMTSEETAVVSSILEPDRWVYNCCLLRATNQVEGFSWDKVAANSSAIQKLSLDLAFRYPLTDIQHILCASSLVWEIPARCGELEGDPPYSETYWIADNPFGLEENSLLPGFSSKLIRFIRIYRKADNWIPTRSPAVLLYSFIFCTSILAIRRKSSATLLFLVPGIVQSIFMALVNLAGDQFRYQYPVYLLGLFALAFLFLPKAEPGNTGDKTPTYQ